MKSPAFPLLLVLAAFFLQPCKLLAQTTTSTFYQSNSAVAPGSAYYISGVITNAVVPAALTLYRLEGAQWVRVNPTPGVTSATSNPRHGYTFAVDQPGTYMIGIQYSNLGRTGAGAFTQPIGVAALGDRTTMNIPLVSQSTAAANNMVWTAQPNQPTVPNVTPSAPWTAANWLPPFLEEPAAITRPPRTSIEEMGETLHMKLDDIVLANVFGDESLSGAFPVEPRGEIVSHLLGSLKVAGLTVDILGTKIKARLKPGYLLSA